MPDQPGSDAAQERARCARLVQAVLDSFPDPTPSHLLITVERVFAGPVGLFNVLSERARCMDILVAAAKLPDGYKRAQVAAAAIRSGLAATQAVAEAQKSAVSNGTDAGAASFVGPEDQMMTKPDETTKVDRALTVDEVGDGIVLDGIPQVNIELTREAALETGIELVNKALKIDDSGFAKP